jgi:hypothetical protein
MHWQRLSRDMPAAESANEAGRRRSRTYGKRLPSSDVTGPDCVVGNTASGNAVVLVGAIQFPQFGFGTLSVPCFT